MPDLRFQEINGGVTTTPSGTDILPYVHDPSGSPADRQSTVNDLLIGETLTTVLQRSEAGSGISKGVPQIQCSFASILAQNSPTTALTTAVKSPAAPGNLSDGQYRWAYTLEYAGGLETLQNSLSIALNIADHTINGQAVLTGFPVITDSEVKFINIYRTLVNDAFNLYRLAQVSTATTTYTDNIADSTLLISPIFPPMTNDTGLFHASYSDYQINSSYGNFPAFSSQPNDGQLNTPYVGNHFEAYILTLGTESGDRSIDLGWWIDAQAAVHAMSGITFNVKNVTAGTTNLTVSDCVIVANSTGGAITLNLPSTSVVDDNRLYIIKDATGTAATNNITIVPNVGQTIDEAASLVINTNRASVTLLPAGSDWMIL